MKHIKTFETIVPLNIKLKPGFMYKHGDTPVGFIGYNVGDTYPLLCYLFRKNVSNNRFEFIEWVSWMDNEKQLPPFNMTIKDYIIDKLMVAETIDDLEKNPIFASGGCKESLQKIKEFKENLLTDPEIRVRYKLEKDIKKYNL